MIKIRKSDERGHFDFGWLNTYHSFSFGDYHDPNHMGFRVLRVINEDYVKPGEGFPTHSHRNMEIVTYVLSGALAHKDSMGNGSAIKPGDVQYMSAGSGVTHSEYNHEKNELTHILQIWILPNQSDATPRYDQKNFPAADRKNKLKMIVSQDGRDSTIAIRQDVKVYASLLGANQSLEHSLDKNRFAWIQVARGALEVNGMQLKAGDGAAIEKETALKLASKADETEFLLFDLP